MTEGVRNWSISTGSGESDAILFYWLKLKQNYKETVRKQHTHTDRGDEYVTLMEDMVLLYLKKYNMSKQQGLFVEGNQSNILYYSWKSQPGMRSIPAEIRQSPLLVAHKNSNGLSTVMGSSLRKLLAGIIPYPQDRQMQTAMRLALLKWLRRGPVTSQPPSAVPYISKISFNEEAVLPNCLRVPLAVSIMAQNEVVVQIPYLKPTTAFIAPPQTNHIRLAIAAAGCNIKTGEALQNHILDIHIPYNSEGINSKAVHLPLEIHAGSLTIIAAALNYYRYDSGTATLIDNDRFRPAEVIGGVVRTE